LSNGQQDTCEQPTVYNRKAKAVGEENETFIPLTTVGVTDPSPALYTGVYSPIY